MATPPEEREEIEKATFRRRVAELRRGLQEPVPPPSPEAEERRRRTFAEREAIVRSLERDIERIEAASEPFERALRAAEQEISRLPTLGLSADEYFRRAEQLVRRQGLLIAKLGEFDRAKDKKRGQIQAFASGRGEFA